MAGNAHHDSGSDTGNRIHSEVGHFHRDIGEINFEGRHCYFINVNMKGQELKVFFEVLIVYRLVLLMMTILMMVVMITTTTMMTLYFPMEKG